MPAAMTLERSVNERLRRGVGVSTPERIRQAGSDSLEVVAGVQRVSQAPLDRLLSKRSITQRQFDAGDRFREDAYAAGMIPSGALAFEPSDRRFGSRVPQFMAASRADAHARWTEAQAILGRLYSMVDEVCWASGPGDRLMDIGARVLGLPSDKRAEVSALAVLRVGLDTLADHYEI